MEHEEALTGGNAAGRVVRIGDTVRKPWTTATASVATLMAALAARGVPVPEHRGRDSRGRQVLEHIPGTKAQELQPLEPNDLRRVGAMVRQLHDAAEGLPLDGDWQVLIPPPEPATLLCHHDLAPWNLIVGDRWAFIDWDGAGPSTRLWDLAYAAQSFAANVPATPVEQTAARLAAVADGYGADAMLRDALPRAIADRPQAMHDRLERAHPDGEEPWATMFVAGHGDHWRRIAEHLAAHTAAWRSALM